MNSRKEKRNALSYLQVCLVITHSSSYVHCMLLSISCGTFSESHLNAQSTQWLLLAELLPPSLGRLLAGNPGVPRNLQLLTTTRLKNPRSMLSSVWHTEVCFYPIDSTWPDKGLFSYIFPANYNQWAKKCFCRTMLISSHCPTKAHYKVFSNCKQNTK